MDPIDLFARSPVVGAVALSALIFVAAVGAMTLWRKRRGTTPPEEHQTRFTSAPDLTIVLIGLVFLFLVVRGVMRFVD